MRRVNRHHEYLRRSTQHHGVAGLRGEDGGVAGVVRVVILRYVRVAVLTDVFKFLQFTREIGSEAARHEVQPPWDLLHIGHVAEEHLSERGDHYENKLHYRVPDANYIHAFVRRKSVPYPAIVLVVGLYCFTRIAQIVFVCPGSQFLKKRSL